MACQARGYRNLCFFRLEQILAHTYTHISHVHMSSCYSVYTYRQCIGGMAWHGMAGQGRAGQGRAGQGRAWAGPGGARNAWFGKWHEGLKKRVKIHCTVPNLCTKWGIKRGAIFLLMLPYPSQVFSLGLSLCKFRVPGSGGEVQDRPGWIRPGVSQENSGLHGLGFRCVCVCVCVGGCAFVHVSARGGGRGAILKLFHCCMKAGCVAVCLPLNLRYP